LWLKAGMTSRPKPARFLWSSPALLQSALQLGGRLFSGEWFGERPVSIVAWEDTVAVAVEAKRDARE
jgi:hypothetical protein